MSCPACYGQNFREKTTAAAATPIALQCFFPEINISFYYYCRMGTIKYSLYNSYNLFFAAPFVSYSSRDRYFSFPPLEGAPLFPLIFA